MASLIQWTLVGGSSGSCWWVGKPGVLPSMWSQRVRHNWATELNWENFWEIDALECQPWASESVGPRAFTLGHPADAGLTTQDSTLRTTVCAILHSPCRNDIRKTGVVLSSVPHKTLSEQRQTAWSSSVGAAVPRPPGSRAEAQARSRAHSRQQGEFYGVLLTHVPSLLCSMQCEQGATGSCFRQKERGTCLRCSGSSGSS